MIIKLSTGSCNWSEKNKLKQQWSESNQSNEANARRSHENEVSEWAERIVHPHSVHSSQEVNEKENNVCRNIYIYIFSRM